MQMPVGVLPLPSDQRQMLHHLTVSHKTTGLSPPDEEILDKLEGKEIETDLLDNENQSVTRHN